MAAKLKNVALIRVWCSDVQLCNSSVPQFLTAACCAVAL